MAHRIFTFSCFFKSIVIHVGGKDLNLSLSAGKVQFVAQHHGYGIGLLTGCARRGPDANRGSRPLRAPCFLITSIRRAFQASRSRKKEVTPIIRSDASSAASPGLSATICRYSLTDSNPLKLHPPSDPARYNTLLVMVKTESGLLAHQEIKGFQLHRSDKSIGSFRHSVPCRKVLLSLWRYPQEEARCPPALS